MDFLLAYMLGYDIKSSTFVAWLMFLYAFFGYYDQTFFPSYIRLGSFTTFLVLKVVNAGFPMLQILLFSIFCASQAHPSVTRSCVYDYCCLLLFFFVKTVHIYMHMYPMIQYIRSLIITISHFMRLWFHIVIIIVAVIDFLS